MNEFNVKIEIYEGPLDLMLALISKHKLNIMDIEISVLLEQFLAYITTMQEADIEIASEFMEMAARLIFIKTASLLPKHEIEELKKELQGTLIEYAICKLAADNLWQQFIGYSVYVREPMDIPTDSTYKNTHDVYVLYDAIKAIYDKDKFASESRAKIKPIIAKSYVSVFTKIMYVLKRLKHSGTVKLKTLYRNQNRSEQVATFLALLELSKYGRVSFSDDNENLIFLGKSKIKRSDNV